MTAVIIKKWTRVGDEWARIPFELTHGSKGWTDKPAKKDEAK